MNEHAEKLRAPFPVNAIKVKPQSVTKDQTKGLVTFYVDARLVAERLNETVGAENWQDEYKVISGPQEGTPVECRLTINGVTKADVGQVAPGELDDKSWKSSYSDAFKRAAVKFGVGAYLYESPNIWAETRVGGNGKAQGFSENGRAVALSEYAKWTGGEAPKASTASFAVAGETVTEPAKRPLVSPQSNGGYVWPSGKHKDEAIENTETSYLEWYRDNGPKPDAKSACVAELARRSGTVAAPAEDPFDSDIPFLPTIDGLGN